MKTAMICLAVVLAMSSVCLSGEAHVIEVKVERSGVGSFKISATVQHNDEGWQHYCDRWEILAMDGALLDTRVLMHPHTGAPFTRSIPGVSIESEMKQIRVRAHDSVHGYGGKEMVVELPGH